MHCIQAETCKQISPNCNYCVLFDVCCAFTVHNILYRFDNTQRYGLSQNVTIKSFQSPLRPCEFQSVIRQCESAGDLTPKQSSKATHFTPTII